ncbi:hypothetical protein F4679DRAFT_520995 [Xylaria curta]|nr:hypothetical protein F4679DRAFT_520995 [Xylaria curta]
MNKIYVCWFYVSVTWTQGTGAAPGNRRARTSTLYTYIIIRATRLAVYLCKSDLMRPDTRVKTRARSERGAFAFMDFRSLPSLKRRTRP